MLSSYLSKGCCQCHLPPLVGFPGDIDTGSFTQRRMILEPEGAPLSSRCTSVMELDSYSKKEGGSTSTDNANLSVPLPLTNYEACLPVAHR